MLFENTKKLTFGCLNSGWFENIDSINLFFEHRSKSVKLWSSLIVRNEDYEHFFKYKSNRKSNKFSEWLTGYSAYNSSISLDYKAHSLIVLSYKYVEIGNVGLSTFVNSLLVNFILEHKPVLISSNTKSKNPRCNGPHLLVSLVNAKIHLLLSLGHLSDHRSLLSDLESIIDFCGRPLITSYSYCRVLLLLSYFEYCNGDMDAVKEMYKKSIGYLSRPFSEVSRRPNSIKLFRELTTTVEVMKCHAQLRSDYKFSYVKDLEEPCEILDLISLHYLRVSGQPFQLCKQGISKYAQSITAKN